MDQHRTEICEDLLSDWQRFARIILLFARRSKQRYEVDPAEYQRLHEMLLKICRALSEREGLENGPFYQELEELLVPWVTLESLTQADGEIVWGLLCRCEQVERVLGGRPAKSVDWRRINLVVLGLAGGTAVVMVVVLATWGGRSGVLAGRTGCQTLVSAGDQRRRREQDGTISGVGGDDCHSGGSRAGVPVDW